MRRKIFKDIYRAGLKLLAMLVAAVVVGGLVFLIQSRTGGSPPWMMHGG